MRHDVIVVGGSFAGLSAALYVARARRRVCVIDTGLPRNRFAAHAHGLFAQDGSVPGEMLATARAQVAAYPTASFVQGRAVDAERSDAGFRVRLATGDLLEAAQLVLAFGIADGLPEIAGLAERWGRSVLHCPYCHGFEFAGRRLGVLAVSPMSLHQAELVAEWGPTTLYLDGIALPDPDALAPLRARGIEIETARVRAVHGDGTALASIELEDGRAAAIDALFLAPRTRLNSDIAERLGCAIDAGPFGPLVRTDEQRATSVPGVFAAGDITRAAHSVTFACADGVAAGISAHRTLVFG
ncbi:NAD(P)/FAD-dependent oxidoreductase [Coralloluteibacterium stylophorae]|uniref:NAD(P)/FAD-dependent oxidoreductase n=1 Tax=Coralloluteibacterium stylophorae TaxID=1776034 RepID=A0A8J7VRH0_9GAMM|nr:NAD(P)/FAD-dependent oxidoreductase [Coralloluteibacterium stylophorae]MBS7457302.1 NAD(P)/FAD-dependent oxidoreductase [Coralloluteibacterium stylophorae]